MRSEGIVGWPGASHVKSLESHFPFSKMEIEISPPALCPQVLRAALRDGSILGNQRSER